MTKYLTTDEPNDTIVLIPADIPATYYSGSFNKGLPTNYFVLDGQGPFKVVKHKRLKINRVDGVFDSFEWIELFDPYDP